MQVILATNRTDPASRCFVGICGSPDGDRCAISPKTATFFRQASDLGLDHGRRPQHGQWRRAGPGARGRSRVWHLSGGGPLGGNRPRQILVPGAQAPAADPRVCDRRCRDRRHRHPDDSADLYGCRDHPDRPRGRSRTQHRRRHAARVARRRGVFQHPVRPVAEPLPRGTDHRQ